MESAVLARRSLLGAYLSPSWTPFQAELVGRPTLNRNTQPTSAGHPQTVNHPFTMTAPGSSAVVSKTLTFSAKFGSASRMSPMDSANQAGLAMLASQQ